MKVHKLAKELGVKSKDIIALFDGHERINHHLDGLFEAEIEFVKLKLAGAIETEYKQDAIETESKQELPKGVTPEQVWLSIRGGGNKSPYYNFKDLAKEPKGL